MKINTLFGKEKTVFSFEVFPPKKDSPIESVFGKLEEICALKPDFISVTYGAGGAGAHSRTCEIAAKIKHDFKVESVAHLTCVSSTRETVQEKIDELKKAGIQNVMALRGDLLPDMHPAESGKWDYSHAIDLVRELKESGADFCIGCACYPEVHPESKNQDEDIKYLKEKVDAGCDFITTQMVFDNNLLYNFMYKIREAGITVPVLPGIMPITRAVQLERAIKLSGSFIPQRFKAIVDRFGNDDFAMMQAGIAYATDQIIDLYANGVKNVHLYTMNKPEVARAIQNNLSSIISR